ncbi:MAG: hypothetical protein LUG50_13395 [Planctomycetaceae bacterium]|nr:hypothetical protein [Planctomycetaceae bacterium]
MDTEIDHLHLITINGKQRAYLNPLEFAALLGISKRALMNERKKHSLYDPDGSRTVSGRKKEMPLWSAELVTLIAFARSTTAQGVRQLSDDEALAIRRAKESKKREYFLAFLDS